MPRIRLNAVSSCAAVAVLAMLPAAIASAVNVALPAQNPLAKPAGVTSFSNGTRVLTLNDGVNNETEPGSMFQIPSGNPNPAGSRGFGYDLGGFVTVESLNLSQFSFTPAPGNQRNRLNDVIVYTSQGAFNFQLPNQDDVTITFPAPVNTAYVMITTVSQHPGNDPQIGIDELAVNSASGVVTPRTNVAAGKTFTTVGPGWNNENGNLTDGIIYGGQDITTARFNNNPVLAGVSIDLDLGSSFTVDGLGLGEHDFGGAGGRTLIENMTLTFSDDPAFGAVNATRNLSLDNTPYQQEAFAAASGRYVRLTFQTVYPNPDANLGFTEVQLFQVIPEPGSLALLSAGGVALLARRRR